METPIALEQEIADIERRLAEKRAELEQKKQSGEIEILPEEKETLHEIVGEKIQEQIPQFQPSVPLPVQAPTTDDQTVTSSPSIQGPLSYLTEEFQNKVQDLINITFQNSLDKAVKQARDINNPALLDAFHGVLVDELYQFLIERGKLKKL